MTSDQRVSIRLSMQEYKALEKVAKSYQMSLNGFCYHCVTRLIDHRLEQIKEGEKPKLVVNNDGDLK
jgi:uncharacterized protein (DUF1778 family)